MANSFPSFKATTLGTIRARNATVAWTTRLPLNRAIA
jgi:hypothetical protein